MARSGEGALHPLVEEKVLRGLDPRRQLLRADRLDVHGAGVEDTIGGTPCVYDAP